MAGLRELREAAGQPSFRQMAAKSGAVSHATLHLAVTGRRLQPWSTVREFVRACDGDEQEWSARWERANAALSGGAAEPEVTAEAGAASDGVSGYGGDLDSGGPGEPAARRGWRSPRFLVPIAVAAVAVLALAGVLAFGGPSTVPTAGNKPNTRQATPGQPAFAGDSSKFVADVTYPDDTVVRPGEQFVKVWQIQNTGTVPWRNRYLQRTDAASDPQDCRTPPRVPINDTAPKEKVQVTVVVSAPRGAADCKVYWKMVDENNRKLLPGNRPIFFKVLVRPRGGND